ncbi:MAG: SPFH domain-containing protein [Phycisphaerales bacterium]|nr:SPFH domain-containing protein [Phycisphaerales bacterium]
MIRRLMVPIAGLLLVALALMGAVAWFTFRVYVPEDMCAVLIRKSGTPLPAGQLVATEPGQKGILVEVLGPGRYFYNPITWDHELKPLTVIPSGDPSTWKWIHSIDLKSGDSARGGTLPVTGSVPQIGVVTRRVGKPPAPGQVIVKRDSGVQGILEEVLTPGTYKINPYVYDVQVHPAVVIPAGFVGVVTNLFGAPPAPANIENEETEFTSLTDRSLADIAAPPLGTGEADGATRPLAEPGQRGTLRNVLQPGVYFINPKLQKVTLVEIGFNEYSQNRISSKEDHRISFPSDTGFLINVEVTVIWGIHPKHAAQIINEFGNIDGVLEKVIGPQLRSIGRNIGSTYAARDFIQGEKRELFQRALTAELQRICRGKNIEVLIALVRDIEVHAPSAGPSGGEITEDLKRTIQQSYLAIESQITKDKQREAAAVRASLEEERKKVEIARETVRAESRVMVANILADAEKQAAEVDAQAQLEVATIQQKVAQLEAQRTEILGRANADVEKMKNESEAKGYEMLVNAFGSGYAYNLYTFAENFKPESIQLFFAGEGTFWTDLSRLQDVGAARLLERASARDAPSADD